MDKIKLYYRGNLPHILPIGATFFITFRLANSLPYAFLHKLKQFLITSLKAIELENAPDQEQQIYDLLLAHFERYDEALDQIRSGEQFLARKDIAQLVAQKIQEFDGQWYDLLAYCIMPNHVHLLLDTGRQIHGLDIDQEVNPKEYKQLFQIMHRIKGATSRQANQMLGRRGAFWQKESYDHFVRNEKELSNFIGYILENPVKAKLVKDWRDWEFTYLKSPE